MAKTGGGAVNLRKEYARHCLLLLLLRLLIWCHPATFQHFSIFSFSPFTALHLADRNFARKNLRYWRDDFKNLKLNTILSSISTDKLNSAHFFSIGAKKKKTTLLNNHLYEFLRSKPKKQDTCQIDKVYCSPPPTMG